MADLAGVSSPLTQSKARPKISLSAVTDTMLPRSLGDIINRFRKSIDLEEVAMADGPVLAKTLKIPHTYCWSPALVPKPRDWSSHIGQYLSDPVTTAFNI